MLIDGRDVRERSQLWLHSHIGYVLQAPHLFSGTIRENIRYGRPDATDEEVLQAARAVHADTLAKKLPQGFDTDVGECGDKLSTGEKQLISFARAIIAKPRIFVLDEATSSVDTATEQLIQRATQTLMQGTTSFVIAHRLSTCLLYTSCSRVICARRRALLPWASRRRLRRRCCACCLRRSSVSRWIMRCSET